MLGSYFVKFLMPIFKERVNFSPNFVSLFNFMKDNSSVLFLAQTIYTLLKRSTLKWNFFETFKCSYQNSSNSSCQFWNVNSSSNFTSFLIASFLIVITPLWILSSYLSYFGLKDLINIPILRLSIALVKICNIPDVIFLTTSQFFFKFCITL